MSERLRDRKESGRAFELAEMEREIEELKRKNALMRVELEHSARVDYCCNECEKFVERAKEVLKKCAGDKCT